MEKDVVGKILEKENWPRGIMVRPWKFKSADAKKASAGQGSVTITKAKENAQPSCNTLVVDVAEKTDLTENGL